jgi:hypothetical protein
VLAVVFLTMLAAAVVIWRVIPRYGLLRSATMLVSKEHWVGPERRNGDIQNYDWLTDTEIMVYRKNADKTVSLLRKQVVPSGETTASVEMPLLPKLNSPFGITMSMERDTLTVLYIYRGAPRKRRMACELISIKDGKRSGPVTEWLLGTYYPGVKAVCSCEHDKELTATLSTFDSRKPRELRITGLKNPGVMVGNVYPLFIEPSGRIVAIGDSYYSGIVTPADAIKLGSKLSPVRSFVEFNLNHPDLPGKTWSIPVPPDAASFYCEVSPQHDRLLWIVQSNKMPVITQLTQRLPKAMRQHPRYLARWMVSDLAGNNMHTIAEYEISDLHFNRPDLITPKWTPDGKNVSFEYNGALYMTSAN